MKRTRNLYGLITAGFGVLLFSSCRKKEQPQPTPDLSIPTQTRQMGTEKDLKPDAEVVASSGPVQLTFRLYKTKVRYGESLWYQIELKNIGNSKIQVRDEIFPFPGRMDDKIAFNRTGIYLDLLNSKGKIPMLRPTPDRLPGDPPNGGALTDIQHAQIEAWQKAGMSYEQIMFKVSDELSARPTIEEPPMPSFWLEPSASTTTTAWARQDPLDKFDGKPRPKPIGRYSELSQFSLPEGRYRIRAIYDKAISNKLLAKYHLKTNEWSVLVKTPIVEFEVLP
ncbi:MAG: hypothetical protein ACHQ51_03535 [Elusimicrobiota bacterium]